MFVFVVWSKTEYRLPKRNRVYHLEPKKVSVQQTKRQQTALSQLGAKKWESADADYTIYRVNVGKAPPASLLSQIHATCESCGLSGPFWGDGKIGWEGTGSGPEKRVNAKIARQISEKYIRDELDLLAQIRVLAGFSSQMEAFTIPGLPDEMKERWTACLTPEIERWKEYLAKQGGEAYASAMRLVSTESQHIAFLNDRENPLNPHFGDLSKNINEKTGKFIKPEPIRESGRKMMQSELDSNDVCKADASVIVYTSFDKAKEIRKREIDSLACELGNVTINGRTWNNVIWG